MYFRIFVLLFILFAPVRDHLLFGATITDDFSSLVNFDSGTAVWNQALGKVHPTLEVVNYKAGFTVLTVDIGDGSHGVFNEDTYADFTTDGDISLGVIRFDTARFPILKVTSFTLAQGYTLEPQGDLPFIVYSLSDIVIEGSIYCMGDNGAAGVTTIVGNGGQGRCGGADGGNGGAVNNPGSNGSESDPLVKGGTRGNFIGATGMGGGGGGSWSNDNPPNDSSNAAGAFGRGGVSSPDAEFTLIAGGAGGGGGSGTSAVAGSGGGGGGGALVFHSVGDFVLGNSVNSTIGYIFASGGAGGSPANNGGPGGGGAGGSVQVFSGGTIHIYNQDVNGASQAVAGAGGTNSAAVGNALGGSGRSWFSSTFYNGIGTYAPGEELPVVNTGNVEFSTTTQYVISKSIDLQSTLSTVQSISTLPASGDFQIEFAGSSDNFVADDTGWISNSALLLGKRFVKVKLSVSTSTPLNPTMIDSLSVEYTPGLQTDFNFSAAGCGRIDTPVPPSQKFSTIFLLLLCLG